MITAANKSNVIDTVTVDGILLSQLEKQKCYNLRCNLGLFARLKNEDRFAQSTMKEYLIQNHHNDADLQKVYDEQFGLVLR